MARSKQSLVDDLIALTSRLPWWAGVVFAMAAYGGLHSVASSEMAGVAQPGKMGEFAGNTLFKSLATVGQYLLPSIFLLSAVLSAYGRFKRGALLEEGVTRPNQGALNDMTWRQFEAVVGEAFRRKGYSVTATGGGAAAGGFDLVLKKEGETFLVQCKQWRALKVGVNTVRDLQGVMAVQRANGGFVVTSGVFTDEARVFAGGKHIELMDGKALHALIRGVQVPRKRGVPNPLSVMTRGAPFCPECQSRMVLRTARRGAHAGQAFWGCLRYPECKGKRRV